MLPRPSPSGPISRTCPRGLGLREFVEGCVADRATTPNRNHRPEAHKLLLLSYIQHKRHLQVTGELSALGRRWPSLALRRPLPVQAPFLFLPRKSNASC